MNQTSIYKILFFKLDINNYNDNFFNPKYIVLQFKLKY